LIGVKVILLLRHAEKGEDNMKAEFTAIIEPAPEGGYWAICPEVPGANGQGETIEETKDNLRQAIELVLEDHRADILRGLPEDAIQEILLIG
jgi:predicted RNase H-like HicB family nuclease